MFDFKHTIDIYTTVVFVLIAWALGISPNSIVLADSSDHFSNIPYLGLCIEREMDGRRIVQFVITPVLLTILILSQNNSKAYSSYKLIQTKLSNEREERYVQLLEKSRNLMKVIEDLFIESVFWNKASSNNCSSFIIQGICQ